MRVAAVGQAETKKVAVLGAGGWGIALGCLLLDANCVPVLWEIDSSAAHRLLTTRELPEKLPGVRIPERIEITDDLAQAVGAAAAVCVVVPSHTVRSVAERLSRLEIKLPLVINFSKGLEVPSLLRLSEVLEHELGGVYDERVVTVSGPSHAEEVARRIPTAVVAASPSDDAAVRVQEMFSTEYFRVYTNADIVGVELGGALKNVIAIAAGIVDGLGLGDNTKGALLTRGMAEITRLGERLGARGATFGGLSGIGDLITTCTSRHSRNRFVGEQIGKGRLLHDILSEMAMVAEGVKTTEAAVRLAEQYGVEMPIADQVHRVLFEGKRPAVALADLMRRDLKPETWG
jgi:glycerol-3-phosphate dehydrogenase (NAD(P)+)